MKFLQSIGTVKVKLNEEDLVIADEDGIRYVMDSSKNVYRVHSFNGTKKSLLVVSLLNSENIIKNSFNHLGIPYREYIFRNL